MTTPLGSSPPPPCKIVSLNFNQDATSLSVATEKGYKLFSLASLDRMETIYTSTIEDGEKVREDDYLCLGW